jgi:hypothetical protein
MASFTKFHQFVEDKNHGVHNLGSDTLKVMLTLTAPVAATSEVKADLTEIAAGNGYTAGGNTLTVSSSGQTSGTYKLVLADSVFTAETGSIADFRYAVVYNDTPTSPADPLIGFFDYGSTVSLPTGETFTIDFDPSTGAITDA